MAKQNKSAPAKNPMSMRVAYLHRVSLHLHSKLASNPAATASTASTNSTANTAATPNIARTYLSHMRSISQKSRLRLPRDIKATTCKRCDAFCAAPSDLQGGAVAVAVAEAEAEAGCDRSGDQDRNQEHRQPEQPEQPASLGATATETIENNSKGGRKEWADVRVKTCATCGVQRRFPMADTLRTVQREKKKTRLANVRANKGS